MSNPIIKGCIERKDFSKLPAKIEIPELLEIQKKSFEKFLQKDIAHDHRKIWDYRRLSKLSYLRF